VSEGAVASDEGYWTGAEATKAAASAQIEPHLVPMCHRGQHARRAPSPRHEANRCRGPNPRPGKNSRPTCSGGGLPVSSRSHRFFISGTIRDATGGSDREGRNRR
jgi:hypothetical protein